MRSFDPDPYAERERARERADQADARRRERGARLWSLLLSLLIAALLLAVAALSYRVYRLESVALPRDRPSAPEPRKVTPREELGGSEKARIALFEAIDNHDPTALIGLPLIATARLLREAGFETP